MCQSQRPFPARWIFVFALGTLLVAQPFRPPHSFAQAVEPAVSASPAATDLAMDVTQDRTTQLPSLENDVPSIGPSLAERIGNLQQTIKTDLVQLESLQAKLVEQNEEQEVASAEYQERNAEFEKQRALLKAAESGPGSSPNNELVELVEKVEAKRTLARERFDLAIETKKTSQQQIVELKAKIQRQQETLDKLLAPDPVEHESGTPPDQAASPAVPATGGEVNNPSPAPVDAQAVAAGGVMTATSIPPPTTVDPAAESGTRVSEELEKAQDQVSQAQAAKEQAEQEAEAVAQGLEALDRNISLEQKAREAARRQGTNAEARIEVLEEELQQSLENGADRAAVQKTQKQIREAQQRIRESREEVKKLRFTLGHATGGTRGYAAGTSDDPPAGRENASGGGISPASARYHQESVYASQYR